MRKTLLLYILTIICSLLTSAAKAQDKFHTNEGIPYIPLLDSAPTADSAGAAYLNSTDNIVYWYDGKQWYPSGILHAYDGTLVVDITSAQTGRIWMDRNLGSTQVADSTYDYNAYGSLFQWCRAPDGHELIIWTSSTTGTAVNDTTSTLSTTITPSHSKFIVSITSPCDWYEDIEGNHFTDGSLWWNGYSVGVNNPCPTGYHVPTQTEWEAELEGFSNYKEAYTSLKLTSTGLRNVYPGLILAAGTGFGYYWSSTVNQKYANGLLLGTGYTYIRSMNRARGMSIRCIKDK